jgi:hypothetical protein
MPRPSIDLHQKVRELLSHVSPPPPESDRPIDHFEHAANETLALIKYIDDHLQLGTMHPAVYERHMFHLRRMALGSLIQAFERFVKGIAIVCVENLVQLVNDDRFEEFKLTGGALAIQFALDKSIGKAMCEPETWLSNRSINERFKKLLKSPFAEQGWENLFPMRGQPPANERDRASTLAILWQIRHNIAHNLVFLTGSDSGKLRLLLEGKAEVEPDKILQPNHADLRYVKRFLLEAAINTNARVGDRLASLLTEIYTSNSRLFAPEEIANRVSSRFGYSLTVAGVAGTV